MHLPGPIRAAVGLVASAADEARHLPDRAIELPMLAVSTALQASLRAQQRYAKLTARGDQVLSRTGPMTEPPAWATFDEPVTVEQLRRSSQFPDEGASTISDLFGAAEPAGAADPAGEEAGGAEKAASVKKTATKKAAAPKKAAAAKKAAKRPAAKKSPAAAPEANSGKAVSKPRHTPPSAFDNAADD